MALQLLQLLCSSTQGGKNDIYQVSLSTRLFQHSLEHSRTAIDPRPVQRCHWSLHRSQRSAASVCTKVGRIPVIYGIYGVYARPVQQKKLTKPKR